MWEDTVLVHEMRIFLDQNALIMKEPFLGYESKYYS